MANKRKKFIPDNWIELMFGVGRNLLYDEDVNGMNTATIRSGVSIGKRF